MREHGRVDCCISSDGCAASLSVNSNSNTFSLNAKGLAALFNMCARPWPCAILRSNYSTRLVELAG